MKEGLNYLQEAQTHLPKSGTLFAKNDYNVEVKVVRGYKQDGQREFRGVYELVMETSGVNTILTLTHDTFLDPAVVGVIINNGHIVRTVGIKDLDIEAKMQAVKTLFKSFNSCQEYRQLSHDNKTGIHYS